MDGENSAHKEQVNIAQQSDKDVEVIPSTSANNQVRSFIIIYHYTGRKIGFTALLTQVKS